MKLFRIIALAAAVALAASCSVLSQTGLASTAIANATTGTSAGSALLGLYTQYKTDGKLDLGNINNITNLATLAKNCQGLKTATDTGSFLSGLIDGSKKLVNQVNGNTVLSSLKSIANLNLGSLTNTATAGTNTNSSGVTTAINTLNTLFQTFNK